MSDDKEKTASFNEIQGIASTNVPAYSNEQDDYISFEGCYIHGIYTGYKWQCVEYARRWLLLRKSCIFRDVGSAADMWEELKHVERVTDGRNFATKIHSNGSLIKPQCESFLLYPRGEGIPYGHIAVICQVEEDFIRVTEQNYRFHYWPGNYSRQIPMVKRDGRYYIEDYYNVYGWMEIEDSDQLIPFNPLEQTVLEKYRQSKSIGKFECCSIANNKIEDYDPIRLKDKDRVYYKVDEDFVLNLSRISNELYQLFRQTTENVIQSDELLIGFGIPKPFWFRIRQSWTDERHFDIIDSLDLKFDGKKLKLCYYKSEHALNSLESASQQEEKIQTMNLPHDFTSNFQLHRLLVRNWKRLNIKTTIHLLIDRNHEEEMNLVLYMKKVMTEAGIDSKLCLFPDDLVWNDSKIVDKDGQLVRIVWKVWNWEMIFQNYPDDQEEEEREHPSLYDILFDFNIRILEPIWKSITSHPILLPVLCAMYPTHPNIFQDEWILSEDSEQIPFFDWSINREIISYDRKESFRIDNSMEECSNDNSIPQELFAHHSDKTIVSWIINGFFSGFSIRDDNENQLIDGKNSSTYCCII